MTATNVEQIEIFINGEYKVFERDMAKEPLSLVDTMYALQLQQKQVLRSNKKQTEKVVDDNIRENINDMAEFTSKFFHNQFTKEQAVKGIQPTAVAHLNELLFKCEGVEDDEEENEEDSKK